MDPVVLVHSLSSIGIFLMLFLAGYAIPLPEEALLLIAGYLAGEGIVNPVTAIVMAMLGVLCQNSIIYLLARSGSPLIKRIEVKHHAVQRFEELLRKNAGKTIVMLRFLVGFRVLAPILSGATHVPYRRFAAFTIIGLALFVTPLVVLGYLFHSSLASVLTQVEAVKHTLFVLAAIAVAIIVGRRIEQLALARIRHKI